jgi:hypothetical protein
MPCAVTQLVKYVFILLTGIACLSLSIGCIGEGQQLSARFEQFVLQVEKDYPQYSEQEWKQMDIKYEKLLASYEKAKQGLSKDERSSINDSIAKYQALRLKGSFKGILNDIEEGAKQLEVFIEELVK